MQNNCLAKCTTFNMFLNVIAINFCFLPFNTLYFYSVLKGDLNILFRNYIVTLLLHLFSTS